VIRVVYAVVIYAVVVYAIIVYMVVIYAVVIYTWLYTYVIVSRQSSVYGSP
jgi:hypothetical protein